MADIGFIEGLTPSASLTFKEASSTSTSSSPSGAYTLLLSGESDGLLSILDISDGSVILDVAITDWLLGISLKFTSSWEWVGHL